MAVEYLNSKQLAEKLLSSAQTIIKLSKKGDIPSVRVGRKYLFDLDRVNAALQKSQARTAERV